MKHITTLKRLRACDAVDQMTTAPGFADRMLTADERLQSELEATRIEKSREEDALRRAFDRAVNRLGYVRAVEAIARECEGIGERDNSDVWAERAAILFQAAEFGEEI